MVHLQSAEAPEAPSQRQLLVDVSANMLASPALFPLHHLVTTRSGIDLMSLPHLENSDPSPGPDFVSACSLDSDCGN